MSYLDKANVSGTTYDLGKPIYYHPIYVSKDGVFRFQCVILDNNATAYTSTTFKAKVKELCDLGAFININGAYQDDSGDDTIFVHLDLIRKYQDDYKIYGDALNEMYIGYDFDTVVDSADEFVDGVNKIN